MTKFLNKVAALAIVAGLGAASAPAAETTAEHPAKKQWSFDGPFGTYDRAAAQRGFQVYREVCAACHSLKRVSFKSLEDIGFSEGQVKALAATYKFKEIGDDGSEAEREGKPSDKIPGPYANDMEGAAANGGKLPPDLSLIVKARHAGPDYVYSLVGEGYGPAPAGVKVPEGLSYNRFFEGHMIAMPAPLADGRVEYADGTKATREQMASDVVQFLMWAAEPKLEARHHMGLMVMLYLAAAAVLAYVANRKLWKDVKKKG